MGMCRICSMYFWTRNQACWFALILFGSERRGLNNRNKLPLQSFDLRLKENIVDHLHVGHLIGRHGVLQPSVLFDQRLALLEQDNEIAQLGTMILSMSIGDLKFQSPDRDLRSARVVSDRRTAFLNAIIVSKEERSVQTL